jgi:hypothetical protein
MSDITNLLSTLSYKQIQDILAVSGLAKEQRLHDERRKSILPEEIIVGLETLPRRTSRGTSRTMPKPTKIRWKKLDLVRRS